jgi:DNA invertase Pin-like site-specific DNA recombinase
MTDAGRSAVKRKDFETYALGQFVANIKAGRVKPGSYLLVENLDRLSRENAGEATELFLSIVNKGVVVVQLSPVVMEFKKPVDTTSLMFAIIELSRGHSESAMKSERSGAAWANKRKHAKEKVLTARVPTWIRHEDGKVSLDAEKAAVVQRLFKMAADGLGLVAIARRLNDEGVPVLGRTHLTVKGETRPVVWSAVNVHRILTSRAAVGEYQPCRGRPGDRKPAGPPVLDYYPPVVDRDTFDEVQAALKTRAVVGCGRRGRYVSLFAGVLRDARTGRNLMARHHPHRESVILPVGATDGRNYRWVSFPLRAFESAVLSELVEVKVEEVDPGAPSGNRVEVLSARLAELEQLSAKWRAKMGRLELVDVVADNLAEIERERKDVAARLGEAQREAASPLSEAVGNLRVVGKSLAEDDGDDNRKRCQAALRRAVESVWCLFMPGRGRRLAAVQVVFKGGRCRNYVIYHRPAASNQHGGDRAAETKVYSFADVHKAGDIDLRDKSDVAELEEWLGSLDPKALAGSR